MLKDSVRVVMMHHLSLYQLHWSDLIDAGWCVQETLMSSYVWVNSIFHLSRVLCFESKHLGVNEHAYDNIGGIKIISLEKYGEDHISSVSIKHNMCNDVRLWKWNTSKTVQKKMCFIIIPCNIFFSFSYSLCILILGLWNMTK